MDRSVLRIANDKISMEESASKKKGDKPVTFHS